MLSLVALVVALTVGVTGATSLGDGSSSSFKQVAAFKLFMNERTFDASESGSSSDNSVGQSSVSTEPHSQNSVHHLSDFKAFTTLTKADDAMDDPIQVATQHAMDDSIRIAEEIHTGNSNNPSDASSAVVATTTEVHTTHITEDSTLRTLSLFSSDMRTADNFESEEQLLQFVEQVFAQLFTGGFFVPFQGHSTADVLQSVNSEVSPEKERVCVYLTFVSTQWKTWFMNAWNAANSRCDVTSEFGRRSIATRALLESWQLLAVKLNPELVVAVSKALAIQMLSSKSTLQFEPRFVASVFQSDTHADMVLFVLKNQLLRELFEARVANKEFE